MDHTAIQLYSKEDQMRVQVSLLGDESHKLNQDLSCFINGFGL